MKISLNSIRAMNTRYGCVEDIARDGVSALVEKIGAQLGGVEGVELFGEKYKGIYIVKVVSCEPHPDSDHMNVCLIDDGQTVSDVKREDTGLIQVVCGAPNVKAGQLVVWLPPGSTVPESWGKEPFILGARQLRGVMSNGMLASVRELALGDDHDGILILDDDNLTPGTSFGKQYDLDGDVVVDIENKMFTHRPDLFGSLGVSRELAGIQAIAFKSPEWYQLNPSIGGIESTELPLHFTNELPELVPRFMAITMRDIVMGPSPVWLRIELSKYGLRSINNIVDYTNFFMLETGQPLHAYDYDKVKALSGDNGASLIVRHPHNNEEITLLNGKTIQPRSEAIMIATDTRVIGLGGVMGGGETEVDQQTKNLIIECATFDMYSIRRTSMAHGLFTDAVTRYNKGQSPLQNRAVLAKIVSEIQTYAGGKIASAVIDSSQLDNRQWVHPPIEIATTFISERLGFEVNGPLVTALLQNVEMTSEEISAGIYKITAPFWRTDIETREDIVEEVGRLYGFDKLPLELPRRSALPATKDAMLSLKSQVRDILSRSGANEVLNYSFVHGSLLDSVGQDKDLAYKVSNALSPGLQYYRMSLTPSLLNLVHMNSKAGYEQFGLFEIGKAHVVDDAHNTGNDATDETVPPEFERVAFVFAGSGKLYADSKAPFYQAKLYALSLLKELGVSAAVEIVPYDPLEYIGIAKQKATMYEVGRSAYLLIGKYNIGEIGEYQASVRKALKLPQFCAGFELDMGVLLDHLNEQKKYTPLSRYPGVTQDITFKVPANKQYNHLYAEIWQEIQDQLTTTMTCQLEPRDIYQNSEEVSSKQITFRLKITDSTQTLTDKEVATMLGLLANAMRQKFNVTQV